MAQADFIRRPRFPLLGRILGWLLLNLLLLGVVFYSVLNFQFRLGINSLLAGPAGDRIQSLSSAVAGALRDSSPETWQQTIDNFSAAYKVQLGLFEPGGEEVAGSVGPLPEEVLEKLRVRRAPGDRLGLGPPPGKGMRLRPEMRLEPQTLFGLRTTNPTRYWVAVRLPPPEPRPGELRRPVPLILFLVTESLYSGSLFLDLRLWLIAAAGTVLISVLLWIPPVRGLTRAISQLTRATDAVANGDFSVRVQANRTDEVGQLGRSVNRMADRLDGFVNGQKRFLGDIAHELCSPLARIQVGLGILEQNAAIQQKPALEDVREEVEEMSGLINELLSFSKASLGKSDAPLEAVRLSEVVQHVVEREGLGAGEIRISIEPTLAVRARADLLRRAIANLARNARRYAGNAGPIDIAAQDLGETIRLTVTDRGSGVPEAELQRIFDPFYRTEVSRSRDTGGAGLGLAIVKSCVEACGGSVHARNLQPRGFEVALLLRKP